MSRMRENDHEYRHNVFLTAVNQNIFREEDDVVPEFSKFQTSYFMYKEFGNRARTQKGDYSSTK